MIPRLMLIAVKFVPPEARESRGDLVGRQPQLEGRELVVLHCLAVLGELELTSYEPSLLELVQVHVQQRPGHLEPPGQLADVNTAPPELGDDPQPMGVRHRRQRRKEFIAGQFQLHGLISNTCQVELTYEKFGRQLSVAPMCGRRAPLTSSAVEELASASVLSQMATEAGMSNWVRAAALDDIFDGGARSFAYLDKRIALFRTPSGVFACDNRCPHQGYALVRGDVKDGVLTCAWHNWKFELGTGICRHGGENIRTYPVRISDGQVLVNITDPPAEVIRPDLFASLNAAMDDLDIGRVARDAMRLQRIGTPLADVVREGVRYAAPRAEFGWDHSLATLADCLRMSQFFAESLRALPVIQGLSVAAENQVRRPARTRPDPVDPVLAYGSIGEALGAYPVLVDQERADEAEALLRGLIAAEVSPAVLKHMLLTAVTDHFLAYGHSMIFVQKAFEMLDQIGWQEADTVLSPLVPEMVLGTRYDKLPYMRKFLRAWGEAEPDLDALAGRGGGASLFDEAGYRLALTDGSPEDAAAVLLRALQTGAPVPAVIDATGRAAAERLARFDIELDLDDTNEWGWLDVTHTLTYLNALRWAWSAAPAASDAGRGRCAPGHRRP